MQGFIPTRQEPRLSPRKTKLGIRRLRIRSDASLILSFFHIPELLPAPDLFIRWTRAVAVTKLEENQETSGKLIFEKKKHCFLPHFKSYHCKNQEYNMTGKNLLCQIVNDVPVAIRKNNERRLRLIKRPQPLNEDARRLARPKQP